MTWHYLLMLRRKTGQICAMRHFRLSHSLIECAGTGFINVDYDGDLHHHKRVFFLLGVLNRWDGPLNKDTS